MSLRRSTVALSLVAALAAALAAAAVHAALSAPAAQARLARTAALVGQLGLTDLALFTEARYTRHPALADLNTPFQDHPMAFEHFPSGSFAPRPGGLFSGAMGRSAEEVGQ